MEFSTVGTFRMVNSILPPTPSTNYSSKENLFKELYKAYSKICTEKYKVSTELLLLDKHFVLHSILHSTPLT